MSMKPEIKEKWVAALRGGEYEQGDSQLRSADNRFCCLGVLCDLAEQAGIVGAHSEDEDGYSYGGSLAYLPREVREWAGLYADDPEVQYEDEDWDGPVEEHLSTINDDGKTFSEIADLIEAQL